MQSRPDDELTIRFARSARKHKIGKARVMFVVENNRPVFSIRNKRYWIGADDRGLILEIVGVVRIDTLIIIHAMPHTFRKEQ